MQSLRMKGVRRVVRMPDAVAVVADSWWRAKRALEALPIEWEDGGNGALSSAKIADAVRAALQRGKSRRLVAPTVTWLLVWHAAQRVEADYEVPFLAHATMEPQTCTAHVTKQGVEVWAPTQAR